MEYTFILLLVKNAPFSLAHVHVVALKYVTLIFQVYRGVSSPADISMDISKLIQTVSISPTSFRDGVVLTLDST
jgi:hypothetical protein